MKPKLTKLPVRERALFARQLGVLADYEELS
jgi:hypothetical protein